MSSQTPNERHLQWMRLAMEQADASRLLAPPNPWVGAVLVANDGTTYFGSTRRPGGNHAEREVLAQAGGAARGSTLYCTLEPCCHQGRTGPCTDSIIEAGVATVVFGVADPDPQVAGKGLRQLETAGITVISGICTEEIERQLAPYLHHRRTGRPYVVLKLAATLDGRTAASDGSSQWITGEEARTDAHRLRAESDAILVGAGTVRDDNPRLTVRGVTAGDGEPVREPLRVVLGHAPAEAAVHPCLELTGELDEVLARLGAEGVVQLMVEGGAGVAGDFHRAGLVDRYVLYLAPALMGGSDGHPLFTGAGAASIAEVMRGSLTDVRRVGADLRLDLLPGPAIPELDLNNT